MVDSHCGSGKTMWAIQHINELEDRQRILFITPFLSECERIINSCPAKNFISPNTKNGHGRKIDSLVKLIDSGKNIVSTHALFSNLNEEILNVIKEKKYILIIDEAMEVLRKINIYDDVRGISGEEGENKTYADLKTLVDKDIIAVSDLDKVSWNDEAILNKYAYIKSRSKMDSLVMLDGTLLMWTFPYKMFKDDFFKEIYLLTYQFDYQLQYYYFKYYDIQYKKVELKKDNSRYELSDTVEGKLDTEFRRYAKNLITICDNKKLNEVGRQSYSNSSHPLSISWFEKNQEGLAIIKKNMINYFKNISESSGKERMWSCFKEHQKGLTSGAASKRNFIAINARATNDFADKKYLAYTINRYLNPCFIRFFAKGGVHVDQDKFALSELIQWIWRSAIRNGEKIYLYIPSERMRCLLQNWLDN